MPQCMHGVVKRTGLAIDRRMAVLKFRNDMVFEYTKHSGSAIVIKGVILPSIMVGHMSCLI